MYMDIYVYVYVYVHVYEYTLCVCVCGCTLDSSQPLPHPHSTNYICMYVPVYMYVCMYIRHVYRYVSLLRLLAGSKVCQVLAEIAYNEHLVARAGQRERIRRSVQARA
jgi:hypothetical protein